MKTVNHARLRQPLLALSAAMLSQAVNAADMLEEVVVTAQKRAESLQDTPVAVTAFTAQTIERYGMDNISQIADFTPNLTFDTTAPISGVSSGAVVFIRGVGQTDFSLTTDPGVGTYVDDVYTSRSIGGVLDVLDVERIEVLRGPQGTLFGRNTIGGAISITSRRPAEEFGVDLEATLGNFDRRDVRAALQLPIGEDLRTSLAVSSKQRDGFVDRELTGGELGDEDRQSARFAALFTPTDSLEFYATYDYTKIDEESAGSVLAGITSGPGTSTFAYNDVFVPENNPPEGLFDSRWLGDDDDKSFGTGVSGTDLDVQGAALTASWGSEAFEIKSITGWRKTDGSFSRDPDNSPIAITETENPDYKHKQFSQEIQLTGSLFDNTLDYVAGLYYFEEDGTDNVFVSIYSEVPTPGSGVAFPLYINNFADVDNSSEAAYAQGTYRFTPDLGLTLGIRHTKDDKEYSYDQFLSTDRAGLNKILGLVGDGPGTVDDSFSKTTYKAGLEYNFSDEGMAYASYSEGFKSGGFNIRYVVPREEPLSFDPEEVASYEVGVKWQGWEDRLRINTAAFYADYTEVQVTLFETGGGPLTQNAGEAELKGIELELTALLTDRLMLNVASGYIDAKYTKINAPTTGIAQPVGDKLPNTPEYTALVGAQYTAPMMGGSLAFRLDYYYSDEIENDAQNSPFLYQDSYSTLNASITFTSPEDTWDLVVFCDNCTDERIISSGDSNFGLGFHEANYNRPREYGVIVRYGL
ncbi:MAG: TonB-dependent receptor [Pseudomonadota bacterium]